MCVCVVTLLKSLPFFLSLDTILVTNHRENREKIQNRPVHSNTHTHTSSEIQREREVNRESVSMSMNS